MANKLNHFFNFISVIAVASFFIPTTYILLGGVGIPNSLVRLPALTFGTVVLGYFFQHAAARLLGQRASKNGLDDGKTGVITNFRISYAVIPILFITVIGVLVRFGFDKYLYYLFTSGVINHFDRFSAYPYIVMLLFILCALAGVIIWFYPLERLSNIYVVIVGTVLFIIEFALSFTAYFDSSSAVLIGVCFAVFVSCMMVIYNQSNLQKTYQGSVVSIITPSSRFYNLLLVGILLIGLLLAFGLSYVVLSGLYLLIRILFYFILYKTFYGHVSNERYMAEYVDMEEEAVNFSKRVMNSNSQYLLSVFFILLFFIIVIIIGVRSGWIQKLYRWIYDVLADFFNTIRIGGELMKDSDPYDNVYNYRDQKKKLQKAAVGDYIGMAEQTDNYKAFLQKLGKLPDYEAQISFAYAMLVSVCRRSNVNLKISDTPREVKGKITHMISEEEIAEITRDFESVKYAKSDLSSAEASSVLNKICVVIKRYIF